MPKCLTYSNNFTNDSGQLYEVYFGDTHQLDSCGEELNQQVIMTASEYVNLRVAAGDLSTIDSALEFITVEEISAVFGTCFAMMVFLGFIGYKIKVAKRLIKSI